MENIKLYQFKRAWGLPNLSPFCMKLETYLRMAEIPHEVVVTNDPRNSPKGKIPYLSFNGNQMGDSSLIIDMLTKKFGDRLNKHLTPEQHAIGLAFQRLCEEHLYWVMVYNRWIDDRGWAVLKPLFFGPLPKLKAAFLSCALRKHMKKELYNQGIGRHTADEVYKMGVDDIKAIAAQLDNKPYLFGDKISSYDACVYSIIANFLHQPMPSPMQDEVNQHSNLISYCENILTHYFPELTSERQK